MDKQSNTRRAAHERAQRYHTVLNTNCCYAKKSVLLLRLWVSATTCGKLPANQERVEP